MAFGKYTHINSSLHSLAGNYDKLRKSLREIRREVAEYKVDDVLEEAEAAFGEESLWKFVVVALYIREKMKDSEFDEDKFIERECPRIVVMSRDELRQEYIEIVLSYEFSLPMFISGEDDKSSSSKLLTVDLYNLMSENVKFPMSSLVVYRYPKLQEAFARYSILKDFCFVNKTTSSDLH